MGSRETQSKIVQSALTLFNKDGASSVSTNRIADAAQISRGNLHYHYPSKEQIVLDIWSRMEAEISEWSGDADEPSVQHMAEMALRQYRLIWRYRFFYRELNILLENDPDLKFRFCRVREQRMQEVFLFFKSLAATGSLKPEVTDEQLRDLIRISWIVSDFWLSFVAVEEDHVDLATMQEGYRLILHSFQPVMTDAAIREIPESFRVFSVEATDDPGL